jgi:hypothetical protein
MKKLSRHSPIWKQSEKNKIIFFLDQTNYTEKFRGIFSVGKHQNTVGCVGIIFFMVNEALVAPQSAEILHPFDLDIARVIDCKL